MKRHLNISLSDIDDTLAKYDVSSSTTTVATPPTPSSTSSSSTSNNSSGRERLFYIFSKIYPLTFFYKV